MKNAFRFLSSFIFSHVIEEKRSEISGKIEVLYSNGKYVLDSAHVNYSFGGLHTVFQKAFKQYDIEKREIKKVLILGFGGGSVASILQHEYRKNSKIVGIEKDEIILEMAKKYFSVDKYKNLTLYCEDAYDFALHSNLKFDLIVMDVFVDLNVPEKFFNEEFLSSLGRLLSENGILFYNLVIHNEKIRAESSSLFEQMNRLIGKTEFCRIIARQTENWVFVSDLASPKSAAKTSETKKALTFLPGP